ncbi:MAG: hypothetical protein WA962_13895 [Ornithinimicrobium sp.]
MAGVNHGRTMALISMSAVLTGCSSSHSTGASPSTERAFVELRNVPVEEIAVDNTVHLRGTTSADAVPDMDVSGILRLKAGCAYVENAEGSTVVVWPYGTDITTAGMVTSVGGQTIQAGEKFSSAGQYIDGAWLTALLGSDPHCHADRYALTADVALMTP